MKNFLFKNSVFFTLLLLLSVSTNLFSQKSNHDLFDSNNEITWLGVDFSEVRFIGPASGWGEVNTKSPTEMRDKYFPAWNDLILAEPKAFKIAEAVSQDNVNNDISAISEANNKTNKKEIFTEDISQYQTLDESAVKSMVKKYNLKGKSGIGFLLIAEGMSKGKEEASYWVTFIDMSTKNVILTKRMTGKAGGFGFRNYWAGSIKSVFKSMKKEFKHWE